MFGCIENNGEINICNNGCALKNTYACLGPKHIESEVLKSMTIDEVIEKYKDIANTDANCPRHCMRPCDKCVQECGQVLEWLEELKALRLERMLPTTNEIIASKVGYDKGYNKAIDDLTNMILTEIKYGVGGNIEDFIKEIAEQLKECEKE